MTALRLNLLGGFEARSEAEMNFPIGTKKGKALLAYLALQPDQSCSRDKLAALLWEERSDARARQCLRQTLTRLRQALAGHRALLIARDDRLALATDAVAVDVLDFERLAVDAAPESLERAIELYRGEFLEGLNPGSVAYEDWLTVQRSHYRERALDALTTSLSHHLVAGADESVLRLAIRLATLDPLRESVHRTLMTLYAKLGRYGTALKQYWVCQAILQREQGSEPEPESTALYQKIVQQRQAAAGVTARDGNGMKAVFGVPVTRSGDAKRTVRAALDSQCAFVRSGVEPAKRASQRG